MANVQKGSKIKFTLAVDANSMGGSSLKDSDFKVSFFAKEFKNTDPTKFYTVNKADATKDAEDDNIYYMVCDTSELEYGAVGGTLEVTYADSDTGKNLTEIVTLTTDVTVVKALQEQEQEPENQGE